MADALLKRRSRIKGSLTRISNLTLDPNTSLDDILVRLEKIDETYREFVEVEDALTLLPNYTTTEFDTFEDRYMKLKAILRKAQRDLSVSQSSATEQIDKLAEQQRSFIEEVSELNKHSTDVQLPRMNIPIFSGDYKAWPEFNDLFTRSIHNKDNLSKAQKFQYLKSFLRGPALNLISNITICDNNYEEARTKLVSRYDRQRFIVQSYIETFFDIQSINAADGQNLRSIADAADNVIRGLRAIGTQAESRDHFLIYVILKKVDSETKEKWAIESADIESPTWSKFSEFLSKRCDGLETTSMLIKKPNVKRSSSLAHHASLPQDSCSHCSGDHKLYDCKDFKSLSVQERSEVVKSHKLCFNCLRGGHPVMSCQLKRTCNICHRRHHSLLHMPFNRVGSRNVNSNREESTQNTGTNNVSAKSNKDECSFKKPHQVNVCEIEPSSSNSLQESSLTTALSCTQFSSLLPTAMVAIQDNHGHFQYCRALLDSGSQVNLITESCAQRLSISRNHARIPITGISTAPAGYTRGVVHIKMSSRFKCDTVFHMNALILSSITSLMPSRPFSITDWDHIHNVPLADPMFNTPATIDILIGASKFFEFILPGQLNSKKSVPIAQRSVFGWVLAGEIPQNDYLCEASTNLATSDVDGLLKKFWDVEEFPPKLLMTDEERLCEEHFLKTSSRDTSGRFVLSLPFKEESNRLGYSKQNALVRLKAMERKFRKNPSFKDDYKKFISEYVSLGHMELIPDDEVSIDATKSFYLPHHAVIKESSTSTKIRVVFDGSCKSSSGHSLNDLLMVGPVVQPTMLTTLLRFRLNPIAMAADIVKMFRQIKIKREDADFQRILWRNNDTDPIQHYRLLTITYGLACAPYQSTRVLNQLADECEEAYPLVASTIRSQFYVDDVLTGTRSVDEAIRLQNQLTSILKAGGFQLMKWKTNNAEVRQKIPIECQEIAPYEINDDSFSIKLLGLQWDPLVDNFTFQYNAKDHEFITKRTILSEVSRLFDPMGLLSPIVIKFKILLQLIWMETLGWDDPVPERILTAWQEMRGQLENVRKITVPRCTITGFSKLQLIGFADASESAYGAVIYLKSFDVFNKPTIRLVTSKSRVAPLKPLTIPRLELCAALLLARLMSTVKQTLPEDVPVEFFNFSDSTVVLSWLSSHPRRWKIFVCNRTSEILDLFPRAHWNYIRTDENPADLVSRGVSTDALVNSSLWWHGPSWLINDSLTWPIVQQIEEVHLEEKSQPIAINVTRIDFFENLCSSVSSYPKLLRRVSYWFQFIEFLRNKKKLVENNRLDAIRKAERFIIQSCQQIAFAKELRNLNAGRDIDTTSSILSLHPFVDNYGILRVGGRLDQASLSYDSRHPYILPHNHHIARLIVAYYHLSWCHAGPTLLIANLRQRFWITRLKELAQKEVHKCIVCFRHKRKISRQLMGSLPKSRISPQIRPFVCVGIDYAGPVQLKMCKGRSKTTYKGYIAIFVCLSTKALHIDIVTSLTTECFLACLKRFISRRGLPSEMNSDNATTFTRANKELRELKQFLFDKRGVIEEFLSFNGISWKFIPPLSPHCGGLWEAGVKSIKFHLKRVTNNMLLSYEELITLLLQIEALLNSRPLSCMNNTPDDLDVLTPAHFIIGQSMTTLPEPCLESVPMNRLRRWQQLEKLKQQFWKQWTKTYLNNMQQRTKWQKNQPNIKHGDLVLLGDDNTPPGVWPRGRIQTIYPGRDGVVRVADVKTAKGLFKRAITRIFKLPIDDPPSTSIKPSEITQPSTETKDAN